MCHGWVSLRLTAAILSGAVSLLSEEQRQAADAAEAEEIKARRARGESKFSGPPVFRKRPEQDSV